MARRTLLRRIGWALVYGALLVFAFLGYQLFITDLLNQRVQEAALAEIDAEFAERREEMVPETTTTTAPDEEPEISLLEEVAGEEGSSLARLTIPAIDVEEVVFEGVSRETLKMGPGHMPGTPVPGQPGNAVVSGHRTTYGRPFYDLDQLEEGDEIEIETALGVHMYEVRSSFIVEPTEVWVTDELEGAWLTLTTCHPQFSAAERLIIRAELVEGPNFDWVVQTFGDGSETDPIRQDPI